MCNAPITYISFANDKPFIFIGREAIFSPESDFRHSCVSLLEEFITHSPSPFFQSNKTVETW
jgi:hypothetical protein